MGTGMVAFGVYGCCSRAGMAKTSGTHASKGCHCSGTSQTPFFILADMLICCFRCYFSLFVSYIFLVLFPSRRWRFLFHQRSSVRWKIESASRRWLLLGGKSKVLLADGSLVWLNSGSTLKYSTDFNEEERIVTLSGEGYFEVSKKNNMPFTVRTQGYDVVVKGTKFNVSAYEGDPFISTTLIEGKVTVNYKNESIDMNPGEEMKIKSTGELQHTSVNVSQSNAWMDNQLVSDNITFQNLMAKLSRRFNVEIEIEDELQHFVAE